ncbi:hypothetical protein [Coxiella endosymbiont of Ornithodoros amblus]|nr:hypothetical protein [Coxiella endosymbiont of Ornithodoros amblus]
MTKQISDKIIENPSGNDDIVKLELNSRLQWLCRQIFPMVASLYD